jgi:predicted metal-dependent hydrolase
MKIDAIRAFAVSKLGWIKDQQRKFEEQLRETPREYIERESHYLWGDRLLLRVIEHDAPPKVEVKQKKLFLYIRPSLSLEKREAILEEWYREQLKAAAEPLLTEWQKRMDVTIGKFFVRKMKTKWGSCNPDRRTIRLNTELAKKPRECLEYIIVHELTHLFERTHNERFVKLMDEFLPGWRARREVLNALPVRHEAWKY